MSIWTIGALAIPLIIAGGKALLHIRLDRQMPFRKGCSSLQHWTTEAGYGRIASVVIQVR